MATLDGATYTAALERLGRRPPFECPDAVCDRLLYSLDALRRHMETYGHKAERREEQVAQPQQPTVSGTPDTPQKRVLNWPFPCDQPGCDYGTDKEAGLRIHQARAHGMKKPGTTPPRETPKKTAGRRAPGSRKSRKSRTPAARPEGRSRRGDRNGHRRALEEAFQLDGARQEAKAICAYLSEEAGWELAPGNEIDLLMAVVHAHRITAEAS